MSVNKLMKAPNGGCKIRMYRHGLGDCFLLAFGAANNEQRYVLIDCGVLTGTTKAKETMEKVAKDIVAATGNHIQTLVITHEHWDHISGFYDAREIFEKLKVDETWLSWTENKDDPMVKTIEKKRKKIVTCLQKTAKRLGTSNSPYAKRFSQLVSFMGTDFSANGKRTTAGIMGWIKKTWPNIKYCRPDLDPCKIEGLPYTLFHVLGPGRDKKYIRRGERKSDDIYHLSLPSASDYSTFKEDSSNRPFADLYSCAGDTVRGTEECGLFDIPARYNAEEWRRIDTDWLEIAGDLALKLDSYTNNTSLVLAIELSPGGKVLLFPGDAQVGNWLSWKNYSYSFDGTHTVDSGDLLARTVFYKVAHHGSHNATLKENGLQKMINPALVAAIPVNQKKALAKKWQMPHPALYEDLLEQTEGKIILADNGIPESDIPQDEDFSAFKTHVRKEELYFEYTIT